MKYAAQHRLRLLADIGNRVGDLDAAKSAPVSGQHLCLDNPGIGRNTLCNVTRLARRVRNVPLRKRKTKTFQEILCLMLVNKHLPATNLSMKVELDSKSL